MASIKSAKGAARRGRSAGPGKYDRSQSPEQRRAEQRALLLGAAAEVFASRGYNGASVDLIIRKVRMSRRTFYDHFNDLDDALVQVYDDGARSLLQRVEKAVQEQTHPVEMTHAGIREYLTAMGENAALTRVLYREIRAAGPAQAARQEAMRARHVSLWTENLTKAYTSGLARRMPSELLAYAVTSAIEAVALRYLDRGEESRILEAAPALVDLAIGAVLHSDEEMATVLGASNGSASETG